MAAKLVLVLFVLSVVKVQAEIGQESSKCKANLVETVPDGMEFKSGPIFGSIANCWLGMIDKANSTIEIASFYWTLLCNDTENSIPKSCSVGEKVFQKLVEAKKRNVQIRIVVNDDANLSSNYDISALESYGVQVSKLNFSQLIGAGVLHTKFIVVDGIMAYIGSANMDWRSLTEVKELGLYSENCPELVNDLSKIFEVYWLIGVSGSIPKEFPKELQTSFNIDSPMPLVINNASVELFFSHSPPEMNPSGRTSDINALIEVIDSAKQFIGIEVMDYNPALVYTTKKYWPEIDNALRRAVFDRSVKVHFLGGKWKYTRRNMLLSLKSLDQLRNVKNGGSIMVKMMKIPSSAEQAKVDHSRVNHCKFIVTESKLYIGTSNWSGDYFVTTAGVGMTIIFKDRENDLRKMLQNLYFRDWESEYSFNISSF